VNRVRRGSPTEPRIHPPAAARARLNAARACLLLGCVMVPSRLRCPRAAHDGTHPPTASKPGAFSTTTARHLCDLHTPNLM
jgi:hypothetical protein